MDKIEQIVALANAGFSKSEIAALMASTAPAAKEPEKVKEPDPKPEKVKNPDPKPTPEPEPEPTPNPEPNPISDEVQKLFASIGMKIDNLANSVHLSNINQGGPIQTESVDDILASIINPPEYKKGDK